MVRDVGKTIKFSLMFSDLLVEVSGTVKHTPILKRHFISYFSGWRFPEAALNHIMKSLKKL